MSGRWVTVIVHVWAGSPGDAADQARRMVAGLNESGARLEEDEIRVVNPYADEGWAL